MSGGPISWMSKKQPSVAILSVESELIAECSTAQEAMWLLAFTDEIKMNLPRSIPILADSTGAIAAAKNHVFSKRTKHIDIKYHFITDLIKDGHIRLDKVNTKNNVADIFTKALGRILFQHFAGKLVCDINT